MSVIYDRQADLFDAAEAQRLRDKGFELAKGADRIQTWKARALEWLKRQGVGYRFTADELIAGVGLPDEGVNRNNVVGAVINAWAHQGLITRTGYFKQSTRKARHGSVQRVWEIL